VRKLRKTRLKTIIQGGSAMFDNSDHNNWMETEFIHKPSGKEERKELKRLLIIELVAVAALAIAIYLS
jgi:hypothetical protein